MSDASASIVRTRRILRARGLRRDQTHVERKMWGMLRGRQLCGFKFRRQHPIDRCFADFACKEARIVIELDGSQHEIAVEYDAARTLHLEQCGWQVLRFRNHEVIDNPHGVAETILSALNLARA